MAHALCSPSSAHRWLVCPGAPTFESYMPDETSEFAQEGTLAHAIAAHLLAPTANPLPAEQLDEDNMRFVNEYVDFVREASQGADEVRIEHPLMIHQVTCEKRSRGTADCLIVSGRLLHIIDLKFGRGVAVDAVENPQAAIYALAALDEFDILYDIDMVKVTIYQPRINNVSEWYISKLELEAKRQSIREKALEVQAIHDATRNAGKPIPSSALHPEAHACKFCGAKAHCPKYARFVEGATGIDIAPAEGDVHPWLAVGDGVDLGHKLDLVDQIEEWCAAVRKRSFDVLAEGGEVVGYKLVAGKRGARRWEDEGAAEVTMRRAGVSLDDMYTMKLISPTQAERLKKKGVLAEEAWDELQPHITQPEGAPTVVPAGDPRARLDLTADKVATVDEFTSL